LKTLVAGASGFVGSHLANYASVHSQLLISCVRESSSIAHLKGINTHIEVLNYESESKLAEALYQLKQKFGPLDLIIHNAGLTKSTDEARLFEVNQHNTIKLAKSIISSGILSAEGKFVYVSSLAARGPYLLGEPVTAYGQSKLYAERELLQLQLPTVIVRPTAVYGPGDTEFLKLFKVIKLGIAPTLSHPKQKLTFVYVKDLARFLVDSTAARPAKSIITLTDGEVYGPSQFYSAIGNSIGTKPLQVRIPSFLVAGYAHLNGSLATVLGHRPTLNPEKLRELVADWNLKYEDNQPEGFYFTDLNQGLAETASYYKNLGLL